MKPDFSASGNSECGEGVSCMLGQATKTRRNGGRVVGGMVNGMTLRKIAYC